VQWVVKDAHALVRSHRNHPAFPTQWLYGLCRTLPGDQVFLSPSLADISANLTPTMRRQDHTILPYASASPVKRASASTASRPAFRDVAQRPSCWGGTDADMKVIWVRRQAQFLKNRIFFRGDEQPASGVTN
jgi:hypothetical protein